MGVAFRKEAFLFNSKKQKKWVSFCSFVLLAALFSVSALAAGANPQMGDNSHTGLWVILLGVSAVLIVVLVVLSLKKKK